MIKIENVEVVGLEAAIRGMRNPMNSWDKSDSRHGMRGDEWSYDPGYIVGAADRELMLKLAKGGPVHAKYRRMIVVYADITAPLYWWKEFDTYKVGTVANSTSTMHKIHSKPFEISDFSHEHLITIKDGEENDIYDECCLLIDDMFTGVDEDTAFDLVFNHDIAGAATPIEVLEGLITLLNNAREHYIETGDKRFWWQMIQLLPSSYNQKRTVMLNYEVLASIYHGGRKDHKLDEWRYGFCKWIETLPYSEVITTKSGKQETNKEKSVKIETLSELYPEYNLVQPVKAVTADYSGYDNKG